MVIVDTNRRYYDRRQYDVGYVLIDGVRVNRRVAERRVSDRLKKKLKGIFDLHMDETVTSEKMKK